MNGEHKAGGGATGATTEDDEAANREALARQDPALTPRMQAMAEIAKKHEDAIEEQLAAEGLSSRITQGEQPTDTRTQAEIDEQGRQEAIEAAAREQAGNDGQPRTPAPKPRAAAKPAIDLKTFGDRPVPMEALDDMQVQVKIDGQDRVMTMRELRRTAQLDGAAHARLQEANALLAQAKTAIATAKPPVGVEGTGGTGDSSATSKDVTAEAESLVDALFVGDKAAAVATVKKLLSAQPAGEPINAEAIAQQLVPAVRQQLSQEEAEAQFRSDFADVVKDPVLVDVADRFFAEAQAADPHKSYAELLAEAGNATRDWLTRTSGTEPATGQGKRNSRQEKLEAKAKLAHEPRGLNGTEPVVEQVIPTHSQVIADMRKARGLA